MRKFTVVIVIVAALSYVDSAAAFRRFNPARAEARATKVTRTINNSLAFAQSYWNNKIPGCGIPRVIVTNKLPVGVLGEAHDYGCFMYLSSIPLLPIWMVSKWGTEFVCQIIVHEWGHLIGLGHIPNTIMDAQEDNQPRVCKGVQL